MLQKQIKQLFRFSICLSFGLSLFSCNKGNDEPLGGRKKGQELVQTKKEKPQADPSSKETDQTSKIIREKTAYTKRTEKRLWNTVYRYEVKVSSLKREACFEWRNYRFLEVYLRKDIVFEKERMWIEFLRNGNNEKLKYYQEGIQLITVGCGRHSGIGRGVIFDKKSSKFRFIPKEEEIFFFEKNYNNLHVRDLISLAYDPERDVLLLKTKTPIFDEDGENPTYELRPREKSLVVEAPIPDDGRVY